jgi:hypothetical protein
MFIGLQTHFNCGSAEQGADGQAADLLYLGVPEKPNAQEQVGPGGEVGARILL